jgi:hypothetical protein
MDPRFCALAGAARDRRQFGRHCFGGGQFAICAPGNQHLRMDQFCDAEVPNSHQLDEGIHQESAVVLHDVTDQLTV